MPPADKSQTMENLGNLLATKAIAKKGGFWSSIINPFLAGHYQQPTKVVINFSLLTCGDQVSLIVLQVCVTGQ